MRRSAAPAGNLRVRRMARAEDDGYDNWAVPGVRATVEAQRLADEIAFAAARLEELRREPPGVYADAARAGGEEGLWLAFLIAYLSPVEGDEPFAGISRARTSWATGELPDLDGVPLGPRAGHDPARGLATLAAYRARAERAGSQAAALASGEASLNPQRRFERAFERLSLPGLRRAPRYEFLVVGRATRPARCRAVVAAVQRRSHRSDGARRQADPGHRRRDQPPAPRERARIGGVRADRGARPGVRELGPPRGGPDHRGLECEPDPAVRGRLGAVLGVA